MCKLSYPLAHLIWEDVSVPVLVNILRLLSSSDVCTLDGGGMEEGGMEEGGREEKREGGSTEGIILVARNLKHNHRTYT